MATKSLLSKKARQRLEMANKTELSKVLTANKLLWDFDLISQKRAWAIWKLCAKLSEGTAMKKLGFKL